MMMMDSMSEREQEWAVQSDFETLVRASDIIKDKERVKKVQEFAKKQKEKFNEVMSKDFLKQIGIK